MIEDLFIHISYIEHFVIRVDLIELEIIKVAEREAFSQLPICLLWQQARRDLRDTLTGC